MEEPDLELVEPKDIAKFIAEVETVIEAIRNGEIEGEYFEF